MRVRHLAVTATLLIGLAHGASAQQQTSVDVSRLPLDLQRIQQQLKRSTSQEQRDGLNLRYSIDVYGKAPRIDIVAPTENLKYGPVPGSAPSHADMMELWTPQEFRAPTMDFSALMRWLADRQADKK
jgi:hypothetical protein